MQLLPMAPEHFPVVAGWLSNPEVNRWLTSEWRDKVIDPKLLAMVVRNKRNLIHVGVVEGKPCSLVGLYEIDPADRCAMIWCLMGERALEGKGLMTDAITRMCEFGFTSLGLANIHAWIMEDNQRSLRLFARAGFRDAGRLRGATVSGGRSVDRVYVDLRPEDLAAAKIRRSSAVAGEPRP